MTNTVSMHPVARLAHIAALRRHGIPIVTRAFLTEEERDDMARRRTDDNAPGDFRRASADAICPHCGFAYRYHPCADPHSYLTILCDGLPVKL